MPRRGGGVLSETPQSASQTAPLLGELRKSKGGAPMAFVHLHNHSEYSLLQVTLDDGRVFADA